MSNRRHEHLKSCCREEELHMCFVPIARLASDSLYIFCLIWSSVHTSDESLRSSVTAMSQSLWKEMTGEQLTRLKKELHIIKQMEWVRQVQLKAKASIDKRVRGSMQADWLIQGWCDTCHPCLQCNTDTWTSKKKLLRICTWPSVFWDLESSHTHWFLLDWARQKRKWHDSLPYSAVLTLWDWLKASVTDWAEWLGNKTAVWLMRLHLLCL